MANIKVRHLRIYESGCYFQPSKSMRAAGFRPEALGKDELAAGARVKSLNDEWDAISHGHRQAPRERPPVGTVDRFIYDTLLSSEHRDKSLSRQDEIEYSCKIIAKVFGPTKMKSVTGERAEKFYSGLRKSGSVHKAAKVMKDFRYLFNRAVRLRKVDFNPGLAFEVKAPDPRSVYWTHDQVESAIKTGVKIGFDGAAVALAIAYDTGLSPKDIRKLTVGEISNGAWTGKREKTGEGFNVELTTETHNLIATYHRDLGVVPMPEALVVRTRRGVPFKKDRLSRDVRHILRAAGIPDAVQMRDLRRNVATELIEAGVTDAELEAAMGVSEKTSGKWRKTYAPASETMARNARLKRKTNMKRAN
jgi:integrase